jgi:creatinine amidohydrolase/Fe(II)-dependent formamide hydrolase-like protein
MRLPLACALATVLAVAVTERLDAQVLSLAELNTDQIRGLDRAKTVVILPGGILEEHGPYLPSYTDGYSNERLARSLAEAVAARPGWTSVLFPAIPLGSGAANEIGRKYSFPGSFTVRSSTVRAIFMDLADELGSLGFRWVLVVHGHGSPHHNRALDDAGRYFQDTYGGRMVHLLGALTGRCCGGWRAAASAEALAEDGFSVHAGMGEHSGGLFLRPDLVPPGIRQAPAITVADTPGLVAAARGDGWPGYFGAPRHATAALGAIYEREATQHAIQLVTSILDGQEVPEPRLADMFIRDPVIRAVIVDSLAHEAEQEARQRAWLARQSPWPPPPAPPK